MLYCAVVLHVLYAYIYVVCIIQYKYNAILIKDIALMTTAVCNPK